jgi:hypothetical protein
MDSLIFYPCAFLGMMSFMDMLPMMAAQAALKTLYEVIVLPVTIRVVEYIKRTEQTDVYDEHISYSILKIGELD